jgi:hypothetical protein
VTNVEPRNARGKHSLAAARSSRRAADADVIIFPFSCWQNLSLMTLLSPSSVAGVDGDDRRESRPQPIEIKAVPGKTILTGTRCTTLVKLPVERWQMRCRRKISQDGHCCELSIAGTCEVNRRMKRTLRLRQIIKYDDYLGKHRATQMEPARALSYRSNSSSCYYMFLVVIVRPLKNGDFIPVRSERPQCSRPQKLKASPSRRTLHISIMEWHAPFM